MHCRKNYESCARPHSEICGLNIVTGSFKKDLSALEAIFDFVDRFADAERLNDIHKFAIHLAVEEIFANMVKHNPGTRNDVTLSLDVEAQQLRICLVDTEVDHFDPRDVPSPQLHHDLEHREPGGLGLFLVKRYFDSIDYDFHGGTSTVTLVKSLEK